MFHRVDKKHNRFYTFAKERDKALSKAGPKLLQAFLPGLSSHVCTTGSDLLGAPCPTNICWSQVKKKPPVVLVCSILERKDCSMFMIWQSLIKY